MQALFLIAFPGRVMQKKILVIVVLYNGEDWIEFCLPPLINKADIDIFCIDNASIDSTAEIIKSRYPQVYFQQSQENLGFGKANNIGFDYFLAGDYSHCLLLNQDARIDYEDLKLLQSLFKDKGRIGIISPIHFNDLINRKIDHEFSEYITEQNTPGLVADILSGVSLQPLYQTRFVNAAIWLMSRDCVEAVGGFDPAFTHYAEDEDYIDRCTNCNLATMIAPRIRAEHRRPVPKERTPASHLAGAVNRKYGQLVLRNKRIGRLEKTDLLFYLRDYSVELFKNLAHFDFAKVKILTQGYKKFIGYIFGTR